VEGKTSGCGDGEGGLDSQIRGKRQGYIPKMLGPRILGTIHPALGLHPS